VTLYESGEELLAQLPKDAGSSCILLDIRIPELSGPELQGRLNEMGSHLPIIFLTGHGDISTTVQVIRAGAEDLLTKPVAKERLLAAIERAIARGRVRQEEDDKLETMRRLVNGLTPRELQVFERVARGRLNKQIAHELGRADGQGAPSQSDGEARDRLSDRACAHRRAPRHAGSACKLERAAPDGNQRQPRRATVSGISGRLALRTMARAGRRS
jgi:FixJ family two-component response regulator